VTSQAAPVSPSLRPSIFQANAEANERGEAFRSDLRSCPTPTLVPGSPDEPRGSWSLLRGRVTVPPDPDNVVPIERPTALPYFISFHQTGPTWPEEQDVAGQRGKSDPVCHPGSLQARVRKRLDQSDRGHRPTEHPEHRGAPDLVSRRPPRELMFDEVEIVMDCVKVAARLIGLAQREGVGGHAHRMPEDGNQTLELGKR